MVLTNLLHGLSALGSFDIAVYLLVGMAIGMFVAMMPGLGTAVALSVLLPFVYHMRVIDMVALMLGAQAGGYYTASITAIVLNTPGAPESYPTTFDGFPMTQRGEAGRALAISAVSTWMGAWISCVIFVALLQLADPLVTSFKAPDYVGVIVMALVLVGLVGDVPIQKVLISGGIGLMFSFVGSDPVTAVNRFTFGLPQLVDGINVVPFALGIFAITQLVIMFGTGRAATNVERGLERGALYNQARQGIAYTFRHPVAVVRSAVLASLLGLVPGIGGFAGNYISYSVGKRVSRNGKSFGSGVPEGLMSAEGSSLAKEVGSLLPAVALGLPSGVGMVLFIAAMTIEGLQPGQSLLRQYPSLPYSMMWVMAITALLSCALGLALSPWLSRVSRLRGPVLFPFIVGLAVLGSYTAVLNGIGMVELLAFGVVGFLARKCNYSLAAMVIGLVLGSTFDDQVHITAETYGWSFLVRFPIADVAFMVALALIAARAFGTARRRRADRGSTRIDTEGRPRMALSDSVANERSLRALRVITASVVLIGSAWYFATALGYPTAAGVIPAVVALMVSVAAAVEVGVQVAHLLHRANPVPPADTAKSLTTPVPSPVALSVALQRSTTSEQMGGGPVPEHGRGVSGHSGIERTTDSVAVARWQDRTGWREAMALVWVGAFTAAVYLFGFEIGLSLAGGLFCITATRWQSRYRQAAFTAVTVATLFLAAVGFVSILHLQYSGLII